MTIDNTKINSRIKKLELLLKQVDKIHLREASAILNVSEMTIRRDLVSTKSMSLLGGYIVNETKNNYFLLEQQDKNIVEKMDVGKLASSLIEDGDVIFFDCGTTIASLASQISDKVKFTAICCSINTFMILQEKINCNIILCGGHYSRDNSLVTSTQSHSILDSVCTTKAFIATSGVDRQQGLTCFRFSEAQVKQKAMAKTQKKILIFDHTKFQQVHSAYIGQLDDFDLIVCNRPIPEEFGIPSERIWGGK
ncbi:DNA-binding transcriptional repressor DeoR [Rodentibacter caecimuris]|uniref:DNA-binding transcriptional repressor DeoR n=1 Tax=Rodentibacter caecimuris TaxID=1796644 RepID=UPI001094455D|nr:MULTISPECIES: DNA-binding transcriptional repressor DeoR [Pasteurellaceae]MCR1838397.1 DNA-binding transcriptional repressor DeoR [Pasteurella caecimuris]MCU0107690.1 DNA-binding transcriptional repressor DeoR [Pasteurella caecimuris]MCX2962109.1 DNA-binding transcriptional repressor DeoR [Rodentibacter heylii]QIA77406.1 DNA-binding transcriptional repressor DeoR [Rodentibacter heylii]TGY47815.1 DNA-binding transcriptional repressor DeoR [Pasteurella caecimuris]